MPMRSDERELLKQAKRFPILIGQEVANAYEWGYSGPVVFVMHGWSGRSTQFADIIHELVDNNYRVVAFDAPAHGTSSGKQTSILSFAEGILDIERRYNDIVAVIGHSMGANALFLALSMGFETNKLVSISMPSTASTVTEGFKNTLNASSKTSDMICDHIETTLGKELKYFTAEHTANASKELNALMIHDKNDKQVSYHDSELVNEMLPNGNLILTEGLGHSRILSDKAIINKVVDFIKD